MKPDVVAAITQIAGDRLTPQMREDIAIAVIRIIDEKNRKAALSVIEDVKQSITSQNNSSPPLTPQET